MLFEALPGHNANFNATAGTLKGASDIVYEIPATTDAIPYDQMSIRTDLLPEAPLFETATTGTPGSIHHLYIRAQ